MRLVQLLKQPKGKSLEFKRDLSSPDGALRSQCNAKRRTLFDPQDDIDCQREQLIADIEGKLQQHASQTGLFFVRWILA